MKRQTALRMFVFLVLVVTDVISEHQTEEEKDESKESSDSFRSLLGGLSAGGNSHKARDMSALNDAIASGNWDRFTPPPVSSPNCHVEVQVVQKIPGRCITLGRHQIPACQTQNWVSFNTDDCIEK